MSTTTCRHLQVTDLAEPARAAALEIDQQLVGVAGPGEKRVRGVVRADRLAAGFDEVPAGSKRGEGFLRRRGLGVLAGREGEEEQDEGEGDTRHGGEVWRGQGLSLACRIRNDTRINTTRAEDD